MLYYYFFINTCHYFQIYKNICKFECIKLVNILTTYKEGFSLLINILAIIHIILYNKFIYYKKYNKKMIVINDNF